MLKTIFGISIKSRVMATIQARIENAQLEFDTAANELDIALKDDILSLEIQCDKQKERLADNLVKSILAGK